MKKNALILTLMTLLSSCFISCKRETGDVLIGTWKSDMGYNSSVSANEEVEMNYVFDGKGNYTFTSSQYGEVHITKGTYKLIDGKYLHTYFSVKNGNGENEERGSLRIGHK